MRCDKVPSPPLTARSWRLQGSAAARVRDDVRRGQSIAIVWLPSEFNETGCPHALPYGEERNHEATVSRNVPGGYYEVTSNSRTTVASSNIASGTRVKRMSASREKRDEQAVFQLTPRDLDA